MTRPVNKSLRSLCLSAVLLTTLTLFVLLLPQRARAGGVVGTGTPASCTEAALDAALAGGGSVTFHCGNGPVTITVTSQKVIAADTTIDGGERIIISGGDATRVFYVNAGVALMLTNLTVSGGAVTGAGVCGGGAFNNGGTLAVINCTISGNHADYDGGGIYSTGGPLLVMNSTFFSNTASHAGGGIEIVDSAADVVNSTFSGNSATYGGGIDVFEFSVPTTLNVVNSTFSGNSAFEGGGIRNNAATVTLKNTIVANSAGWNCDNYGTLNDGGGNLQYGGGTSDSCGATIPTGDPNLGALADNGGPTWTMALLAGSAALDAADNSTCLNAPVNNLDQRGSPRRMDAQCDIGAFEYDASQTGPTFTVNSTGGTDDGVCGVGNCRLREAINAANAHAGADTIELAAGAAYTLTMVDNFDAWYMGTGLPVIASDITVNAHGATIARSQAAGTPLFRFFYVGAGGILRLNQATLRGGDVTGRYGGGIFNNSGTLIVTDSTLSNNVAYQGGGIENFGILTVAHSTFSNNTAFWGGGIACYWPAVVVNSTFSGNSADSGGGIYNASTSTVINSTFSGNGATEGGNINNGGTVTLKNTIVANSAGANCYGAITDGGGNLQYGGSTPNSCGATIPTGDPRLGALADNGGPTWTMALSYSSAARDAAADATCAAAPVNNLDQRGVARPLGAHCDVGAYETPFVHGIFLPLTLRDD
jgi:CSLREA domain-containing protein